MSEERPSRDRASLARAAAEGSEKRRPRPSAPPAPPLAFAAERCALPMPPSTTAERHAAPPPAQLAGEFARLLATIQLDAAVLEDGHMDDEERRALAAEIVTASERLAELARPLLRQAQPSPAPAALTPSRPAQGTARPEPPPLPAPPHPDLNEVVARTAATLGKVLAGDVEVTVVRCPERLRVPREEALLRQALFRLAVAAHESLEPGGGLQLETQRMEITARQAAWIGGLPPGVYASLRLIWPASHRPPAQPRPARGPDGRPATTRFVRGLADAQRLVTEAGGHLQVAVTPGAPSWFTVLLPIAPLPEDATRRALRDSWPTTTGATVLVVDADPSQRSQSVLALRAAGYRVLEAETAEEALLILDDPGPPPKLLLTEVVLPGMPGGELAATLGRRFPRLQVLYTASVARPVVLASGDLSPDAPFVAKPHREAELLTVVRRLLDLPTG